MSSILVKVDVRCAIKKAGGAKIAADACNARGVTVTAVQLRSWAFRNSFPKTEWTGETSVAGVICELIFVLRREVVSPLSLCLGAGQYMTRPEEEAA